MSYSGVVVWNGSKNRCLAWSMKLLYKKKNWIHLRICHWKKQLHQMISAVCIVGGIVTPIWGWPKSNVRSVSFSHSWLAAFFLVCLFQLSCQDEVGHMAVLFDWLFANFFKWIYFRICVIRDMCILTLSFKFVICKWISTWESHIGYQLVCFLAVRNHE